MATTPNNAIEFESQNDAASLSSTLASPRHWLRWLSLGIGLIGLSIALYLTYAKVTESATACPANATFDCEFVQHSYYSQIAGLPIVYIGLAGYLAIVAVLLLEWRVPFFTKRGPLIVFAMTFFGFLYSAFLTSTEAFTLHKWCLWCMGSATAMTALFIVSSVRAWRQFSAVPDDLLLEEALSDEE